MIEAGPVLARPIDLLRLLAVPAFAWAAWRDVQVRRVPDRLWPPLAVLGVVLLLADARYHHGLGGVDWRLFVVGAAVSLLVVVPLSYAFWLVGGFGGADVKALATLAVLLPTFPTYDLPGATYPLVEPTVGAFGLTVLSNAVVVGLAYPVALAVANLLRGDVSRWMAVGRTRRWDELPAAHGRLLEDGDGFTRSGLDLDALRMYCRWRDLNLAELRDRADELRDPATLPEEPAPPTDGAVRTDGGAPAADADPGAACGTGADGAPSGDPWGAEAFLADLEGEAYGTDAETLRGGLEVVTTRERVWYSPGIPFIVPVFLGLVVGLTYGDVVFGVLGALGLA